MRAFGIVALIGCLAVASCAQSVEEQNRQMNEANRQRALRAFYPNLSPEEAERRIQQREAVAADIQRMHERQEKQNVEFAAHDDVARQKIASVDFAGIRIGMSLGQVISTLKREGYELSDLGWGMGTHMAADGIKFTSGCGLDTNKVNGKQLKVNLCSVGTFGLKKVEGPTTYTIHLMFTRTATDQKSDLLNNAKVYFIKGTIYVKPTGAGITDDFYQEMLDNKYGRLRGREYAGSTPRTYARCAQSHTYPIDYEVASAGQDGFYMGVGVSCEFSAHAGLNGATVYIYDGLYGGLTNRAVIEAQAGRTFHDTNLPTPHF